jgi:hypothetical protein
MCLHATIYVSAYYYMCPHAAATQEQALLAAIWRAVSEACDVYESEPRGNEVVKLENNLARQPSVVCTHHTAASTTQAIFDDHDTVTWVFMRERGHTLFQKIDYFRKCTIE